MLVINNQQLQDLHYILIGTLDDSCRTLRLALTLLDFRLPLKFACVRESHRLMICDVAKAQRENCQLTHDDLTECFHLPADIVNELNYEVPDGFELRSLVDSDIETIDSLWPHRFPGSKSYLANLIANNISLGLFHVADNEIAGWVLWFVCKRIKFRWL